MVGQNATPSTALDQYAGYMLPQSTASATDGAIRVTWYGTTMFLIDDGDVQLLFDAFITQPSVETVVRSFENDAALIQTDTAAVDAWLARPEVA